MPLPALLLLGRRGCFHRVLLGMLTCGAAFTDLCRPLALRPSPPIHMTSLLRDIGQSAFLCWIGKAVISWQGAWSSRKVASLEQSPCYRVLLGLCLS